MHAFDFMEVRSLSVLPFITIASGESFVARLAIQHAIQISRFSEDAVRWFDADDADWRSVHDELSTFSLFDTRNQRVAVVFYADDFLSANRLHLEKMIERPPENAHLFLSVRSILKTTRIYKMAIERGMIVDCSPPEAKKLQKWLMQRALGTYQFELSPSQATFILDRVGNQIGLLDCELAKIALFADDQGRVDLKHLQELVGGWRTHTAFQIAEAIANGHIAEAITHLDRLLNSGEHVLALLGGISWSLRRFGLAARLIAQSEQYGERPNIGSILAQAGFRPFETAKAEKQLKRIGRRRALMLPTWICDLEMALKGSHSSDDRSRMAVELFILRFGDGDYATAPPKMKDTVAS